MHNRREIAYALLRVTVGVMFLFFGIGKLLRGVEKFAAGMQGRFAESPLPEGLVTPFAYVLPFAEVAIGSLLVLGLFNVVALVLAALLVLGLTFGVVMQPDPPTVAHNVNYALVIFVLLWLAEYNAYSLDRMLRRGPPRRD
jgi:thiosulfate dehydrogenase [quinone] large subunit